MIVFNWPDRCPGCHSEDIMPVQAVLEGGTAIPPPKGYQTFACKTCEAVWGEQLVTSEQAPCFVTVMGKHWHEPVAVLTHSPAHVRALFKIDKDVDEHVIARLEGVLDAGERRVQYVKNHPLSFREFWLPPPGGDPVPEEQGG